MNDDLVKKPDTVLVVSNREREFAQLNARLVEKMAADTKPPPDGMVAKLTEAIVSVFTPEEYKELSDRCVVTGESISLEIAKKFLSLPRAERKRLCKKFGIPWQYLNKAQ